MTLTTFLEHWRITENPFRGEEARQDPVFLRLEAPAAAGLVIPAPAHAAPPPTTSTITVQDGPASAAAPPSAPWSSAATVHSEFEKIAGDFDRPASSIVFGEKGSGKTAIRLQIADRVALHNAANPQARCLLVAYDDLNPVLDRFIERVGHERRPNTTETLSKFRLVDHMDAILGLVVPRVVDTFLKDRADEAAGPIDTRPIDLGEEPRRAIRRFDPAFRQELLLLQSLYDRAEGAGGSRGADAGTLAASLPGLSTPAGGTAEERTRRLRRVLRLPLPTGYVVWTVLAYAGWLLPAAAIAHASAADRLRLDGGWPMWLAAAATLLYLLVLAKRSIWDRLAFMRLGHRIRKQIRTSLRSDLSFARSLRQLHPSLLSPAVLPLSPVTAGGPAPGTGGAPAARPAPAGGDEHRYAMFARLRRILRQFGIAGMIIVIDRVDEPTAIAGDPDRMRAVIWPLLNNKFLQQSDLGGTPAPVPADGRAAAPVVGGGAGGGWGGGGGVGVKMLLPMELRHALFRESAAFFQEARLDKQNLVERLTWTGPMLYDLCNARLRACLAPPDANSPAAPPITLLDLFAEDVARSDLVEALGQMQQPRDAFKLLYHCIAEHCAGVTSDQPAWRIPRHVLEQVKKQQVERVAQLSRGLRPA